MNFFHSIKFRFTLWYISVFTLLILLLGTGVYFSLSHMLHRNMDDTLERRAEQLAGFRNIISIVAGGTFEGEFSERMAFYFYDKGKLRHVAHGGRLPPVDTAAIDRAVKGEGSFSTMELSPGRRFRIRIAPFTPVSRPSVNKNPASESEARSTRLKENGTVTKARRPRLEDEGYDTEARRPRPEDEGYDTEAHRPRPKDEQYGREGRRPRPGEERYDRGGRRPRPGGERYGREGRRPRPGDEQYDMDGRRPRPGGERYGMEGRRSRPEDERYDTAGRRPRSEDERYETEGRRSRPEDEQDGGEARRHRPEKERRGAEYHNPGPDNNRRKSEAGPGRVEEDPGRNLSPPRRYRPTGPVRSAALVVARPMGEMELALERLLEVFLVLGPLVILLSAGGGLFLARRAFKPVEEMAETARSIQENDLSGRIEVQTRDELGHLAETLNRMLQRLQKAFERQKQFTGDASHELRGPLAIIQAESSLALHKERKPLEYRNTLEVITRESGRMTGIIEQLLFLARADAGKEQPAFERLDLSGLVRDLCRDIEIICTEKAILLRVELPGSITVNGDRGSLRRLLHNLLGNALRHTDGRGSITVGMRRESGGVIIKVMDTGTGIPPEALPHIFERFYRVDKARTREAGGSGLGLAICRQIVEMHGGRMSVRSRVGEGSVFSVHLPCLSEPGAGNRS